MGAGKLKICRQTGRLEILVKIDAAVLSPKAGESGRISMLQSGSRVTSSLGNLKGNLFALKTFN